VEVTGTFMIDAGKKMLVEEIPPSISEPQDSGLKRIQYAPQMQPWQAENLKARYRKYIPLRHQIPMQT